MAKGTDVMTVAEVAKALGVSRMTVWRWRTGKVKGQRARLAVVDVMAYLRSAGR